MPDLMVWPMGAAVFIGPEKDRVEGQVLGVNIRGANVSYEVAWWDGKTYRTAWLEACQLSYKDASNMRVVRIGFAESPP